MCAGKKWLKAQIRTHVGQFLLAQTGGCHSVNTSAAQVSSRQRERTGVKRARCAWWDTHKSSACISALVMHAGSRKAGIAKTRWRRNDAVCFAFQRAFQMWRCRRRSRARTARRRRLASTVATCWACRSCSVDVRWSLEELWWCWEAWRVMTPSAWETGKCVGRNLRRCLVLIK